MVQAFRLYDLMTAETHNAHINCGHCTTQIGMHIGDRNQLTKTMCTFYWCVSSAFNVRLSYIIKCRYIMHVCLHLTHIFQRRRRICNRQRLRPAKSKAAAAQASRTPQTTFNRRRIRLYTRHNVGLQPNTRSLCVCDCCLHAFTHSIFGACGSKTQAYYTKHLRRENARFTLLVRSIGWLVGWLVGLAIVFRCGCVHVHLGYMRELFRNRKSGKRAHSWVRTQQWWMMCLFVCI